MKQASNNDRHARLVMTLLVRDEEALVKYNIDYHLSRGVDFIIATDNRSEDSTPKILKHYERHGCLRYIYERADDYSQDVWVTRMARMAREEFNADWVFHVDADEFWWPQAGRNLKQVLHEVPHEISGLQIERHNFVTPHDYKNNKPFYTQMIFRERQSLNTLCKPLPPKVVHRGRADVIIQQGNHNFTLEEESCKVWKSNEIQIWHFPVRSYEEFEDRISKGGAAYARNQRFSERVGRTWRELYKEKLRGNLRARYDKLIYSRKALEVGQGRGDLILDTRFRDYMKALQQDNQYFRGKNGSA